MQKGAIGLMNQEKNNSYLSNLEQDGWNDIQAYHIENEAIWRRITILAILALAIVSIIAMYLVNQDKHKTLVFEKDSSGNITVLGLATKTFNIDNKVIAHQLVNFILALREVPQDLSSKRRNIDLVHKMIDPKIKPMIDQMLFNQYTKADGQQILVTVKQIKPFEGGKSWVLSWSEENVLIENGIKKSTSYSSVITFTKHDSVDLQVQLINPVGIFITYLNPVEDVNGAL